MDTKSQLEKITEGYHPSNLIRNVMSSIIELQDL